MTEIVKIYRDIPVRIIERDGELWFPFKDLCRVLRCENSSKKFKTFDADEIDTIRLKDSTGRKNRMRIVNESALWAMLINSRSPEAPRFKKWFVYKAIPEAVKEVRRANDKDIPARVQRLEEMSEVFVGLILTLGRIFGVNHE